MKSFEIERENNFETLTSDQILEVLNNYRGKNILLFDEDMAIEEIGRKIPNAKVLNVERVFPSKIVFNIEEREPFYAIYEDSKYYIFDVENYFLGTSEDRNIEESVIMLKGMDFANLEDIKNGEPIIFQGEEDSMALVNKYFELMLKLDFSYTEFQTTYFLKNVEVAYGKDMYITTRLGVKFCIYDAGENLDRKVQFLMGAYSPDELAVLSGQTIYIGNNLVPTLSGNN